MFLWKYYNLAKLKHEQFQKSYNGHGNKEERRKALRGAEAIRKEIKEKKYWCKSLFTIHNKSLHIINFV